MSRFLLDIDECTIEELEEFIADLESVLRSRKIRKGYDKSKEARL